MRYRYLIWDFDGTLFDTYPALVRSIERALADHNLTVPRGELEHMLAETLQFCFETLVERFSLDADAFDARIEHYHRQTTVRDKPPFPGVIRLCERFVKAGGQNFIITHRDHDSLMQLLTWYKVEGLFAATITRDDGYPRKPDPASFEALLERRALPCDQVLAVGDRDLDVLAGQAAGVHTCLFNATPGDGVQPDHTIASFAELEALLELGSQPYRRTPPANDYGASRP